LTFSDSFPTLVGVKVKRIRRSAGENEGNARAAHIIVEEGSVSVRIYKREKTVNRTAYTIFELADYSSGARKLRSFSDEEKAISEAKRIAELMRKGDSEGLLLKGEDRAVYVRAKEHVKTIGLPLDIVAARYAESVKIMDGDFVVEASKSYAKRNPARLPKKSVAEAVEQFITAKEKAGKSHRHIQDLRHRLNKLAMAFPGPLSSISGDLLQAWLDKMTKLSPRSKEHFRTKAAMFFRWCQRQGYLPKEWDELDRVEKIKVIDGDVEIFTPEEAERLLKAADNKFRPALAIQLFAGLRTAEVERLRWEDVNLAERYITVKAGAAKTASRRIVPIIDALAAWLTGLTRKAGPVWRGGKTTICDAQQATSKATAVEANPKKHMAARAAVKWKHNAARHSFISYRLAEIKNVNQVALEAGNSATMIFKHYRELVRETDAKRYFAILPNQPTNVTSLARAANGKAISSAASTSVQVSAPATAALRNVLPLEFSGADESASEPTARLP
jgi:integrase